MEIRRVNEIIDGYLAMAKADFEKTYPDEEFRLEYDCEEDDLSNSPDALQELLFTDWYLAEKTPEWLEENKAILNSIKQVDSYGGEGKGDEYWLVFKFTDPDTGEEAFVRYAGYYSSWEGTNWDGADPVFVTEGVKQVKIWLPEPDYV